MEHDEHHSTGFIYFGLVIICGHMYSSCSICDTRSIRSYCLVQVGKDYVITGLHPLSASIVISSGVSIEHDEVVSSSSFRNCVGRQTC